MTDTLKVELRGPTDQCIMNLESLTRFSTIEQLDINLVRLYLQVITLSDMSTSDGFDICSYMLDGQRNPAKNIRLKTWPRHTAPTAAQKRVWYQYITTNYIRYGTKWNEQLKLPPLPARSTALTDNLPRSNIHFPTLRAHIKSLPT